MTLSTLFKITPEPLGLDLSDRSIKIAKLRKKSSGFVLENFGEKEIPAGLMENGIILSLDALAKVVKESVEGLKMGRAKTSYVACSLPEQHTYLRVVQLPRMKEEEVSEAVRWELEANIPLSLEEVYFDRAIIKPATALTHDHFDVLVTAAPRKLVDSYAALFEKAELKLFSLEPESLALSRSVISDKKEGAIMVVDIGFTHMCVAIYAGKSVRFSSSVEKISGRILNKAIAHAMGIDEQEAEKLKKDIGLDKKENGKIFKALEPTLEILKDHLTGYINFYSAHASHAHDGAAISEILLSGGEAHLKGIEKYLASSLDIPVRKADPWVNILDEKIKEVPRISKKESLRYSTALGLALSSFFHENEV